MKQLTPIAKYSCQLVKEPICDDFYKENKFVHNTSEAVDIIKALTNIQTSPLEQFWVVFLNTRAQVIGHCMVAQGDMYSSNVDVRAVFRAAILVNAHAILLAHNHPSGNPKPSEDDLKLTKQLIEAGKILCISVVDHIIIGMDEDSCSLSGDGFIEF